MSFLGLTAYLICIGQWTPFREVTKSGRLSDKSYRLTLVKQMSSISNAMVKKRWRGEELTNVGAPCHLQPAQVSNLCCPYNPSRAKYHQLQTLSYKHQLHIAMMYFISGKWDSETVFLSPLKRRFGLLWEMHTFQMFWGLSQAQKYWSQHKRNFWHCKN